MTDQPNRDAIDAVHIGRMTAAKAEHESATGTFRGVYAQAERMGVNIPAAKKAMKLKAKGKLDEYLGEVRDVLRYLRLFGIRPEPSQLDFLDQDPSLIPLEERAYDDGLREGRLQEGLANPHDENSKAGKKWADGWRQGRTERDLVMAMKMDDEDEPDDESGEGEGEIDDPFSQAAE
jgi:hypothetical protein